MATTLRGPLIVLHSAGTGVQQLFPVVHLLAGPHWLRPSCPALPSGMALSLSRESAAPLLLSVVPHVLATRIRAVNAAVTRVNRGSEGKLKLLADLAQSIFRPPSMSGGISISGQLQVTCQERSSDLRGRTWRR
jgi:hypothetical protein